jgi:hypothetical protein
MLKSWDYDNKTKIKFKNGYFKKNYRLDAGNFYFIELRDENGKFWYAYKFTLNRDTTLNLDLGKQEVTIKACKPSDLNIKKLFLLINDNLIPMMYDPAQKCFITKYLFPVNKKIKFYLTDNDGYYYGPIEYVSDNIYERTMELKLIKNESLNKK